MEKISVMPNTITSITQSDKLIAFVMGGAIYASKDAGKSFKKYQGK